MSSPHPGRNQFEIENFGKGPARDLRVLWYLDKAVYSNGRVCWNEKLSTLDSYRPEVADLQPGEKSMVLHLPLTPPKQHDKRLQNLSGRLTLMCVDNWGNESHQSYDFELRRCSCGDPDRIVFITNEVPENQVAKTISPLNEKTSGTRDSYVW